METPEGFADWTVRKDGGLASQWASYRLGGRGLCQSAALAAELAITGAAGAIWWSGSLPFSSFAFVAADYAGSRLPTFFTLAAAPSTPGPVTLSFQASTGQLAIRAQSGEHTIRQASGPDGFVDVTIDGQSHSSNQASASFDRALQGAAAATLTGIHFEGGGQDQLIVGSQQHAGGFTVQATGATVAMENVIAAGLLAIQAPNITVTGALRASAINLAATEWLTINAAGRGDAENAASTGMIQVDASVFVNSGQLHADGPRGGQINIAAGKILNDGLITANGTAPGGSGGEVHIAFADAYVATTQALISTSSAAGPGGRVIVDGHTAGRLYSSGSHVATGASGGAVALLGRDIVLAGALIDVSGETGGGSARLGGDPQSDPPAEDAQTVTVTSPSIVRADAVRIGGGGRVSVRAIQSTIFDGTASARGGTSGGPGGFVDLSGQGNLSYGGSSDAGAISGQNGTLLLDPKNITIADAPTGVFPQYDLIDPHPTAGDGFGRTVSALSNGNVVVTNPADDFGGANAGAVYLFDGSSGALIASLVGSNAGDQVGSPGVTPLTNGNYVVQSLLWNESRGAATWGDGSTGVSGIVSEANSLVGSNPRDQVGQYGVTPLNNGNYVVESPNWNGNSGAVTWGDGSTGGRGTLSEANSLVGNPGDQVGSHGAVPLSNGNYVIESPHWDDNRGAVTWADGATGVNGTPSDANSLVGSDPGDQVGQYNVIPLGNGNYVVQSPAWSGGRGAITWGDGSMGVRGTVSDANSLVGNDPGDGLGFPGATALANGNYVVSFPNWGNNRGAVTWEDGSTPVSGTIAEANSLVGNPNDYIGSTGITPLSNGNYVVQSPAWNGARGAVTWENGSSPVSGVVAEGNSLTGSNPGDLVGFVTPLSNGNYVVSSPNWNGNRGAVTWENGSMAASETVSEANSLVGNPGDAVGVVVPLSNGNYVVGSPSWNGQRGAVTWGDGTTGVRGTVSEANSLVGGNPGDSVDEGGTTAIIPLSNGNYVVRSPHWNGGFFLARGAVTWGDGNLGIRGLVSDVNSLVGSNPGDRLGDHVASFSNGDYVVGSSNWNDQRGAVTWGSGTTGQTLDRTGVVTPQNSLLGQAANSFLGLAALDQSQRSFLAQGGGRVTVGLTDPNPFSYALGQTQTVTLTPNFLTRTLETGTAVVLQASNDITVNSPITVNAGGQGGSMTLQAGRTININANITTDNGDLTLIANDQLANGVVDSQRDPGSAVLTMAPGTALDTGSATLAVELRDGTGLANSDSGAITLQTITAGSASVINNGPTVDSDVILGPVTTTGPQSYANPNGTTLVTGNLTSGDNPITFNHSVTLHAGLTLSAGSSTVDFAAGTITPGVGVLTIAAGVDFTGSTTLSLTLNGLDLGGYSQLITSGPIALGGTTLNLLLAFDPPVGSSFEILTNTGSAPINGTFKSLDEGAIFTQGFYQFQITYQGGTGGDSVVLTRVV
jgi:hypothetical protein